MFKNVLLTIGLHNKDEQKKALEVAKKYADEGSNLYIMTVIPLVEGSGIVQSFLPANYDKALLEKGQETLHEFTHDYIPASDKVKHIVAHGKVYEKVTDVADKLDIDLIITMASIRDKGFGPNVARIVRNSECSVMVLR